MIVFTSSLEESDRSKVTRLGANNYVVKPVAFSEFMACRHRPAASPCLDSPTGHSENQTLCRRENDLSRRLGLAGG